MMYINLRRMILWNALVFLSQLFFIKINQEAVTEKFSNFSHIQFTLAGHLVNINCINLLENMVYHT